MRYSAGDPSFETTGNPHARASSTAASFQVVAAAVDEGTALTDALNRLVAEGFPVDVVSAGSTPTTGVARPAAVTEERPGSYVFHDRQQLGLGACRGDQVALTWNEEAVRWLDS